MSGLAALVGRCTTGNYSGLLVNGSITNDGYAAKGNCTTNRCAANQCRMTDVNAANNCPVADDPSCVLAGCCSADSNLTALPVP